MALGIISKMCVMDETTFGVYDGGAAKKRVELSDDSMTADFGYKDPETISGVRIKATNIQTQKKVDGSVSIVAAPENGFTKFLKYAAGGVTTLSGQFRRERITGETGIDLLLAHVPITALSDTLYKKTLGGAWKKLTRVAGPGPGALEYTINATTGEIELGTALIATDEIMAEYAEVKVGVYSHVYKAADQGSFQYWNYKGQIELFEYTGCKIDKMKISVSAEDFLKADCDIVAQDEKLGSDTTHTFPTDLDLSGLDPFIFKQATAKLDWANETMLEKVEIEISNNLDPRYSIRGDNTVRAITPGKQEFAISTELEFVDMTYYNKFRNATRGILEIIYGAVNGVEIGNTGVNYQFQIFVPNFRFESADLPTSTDTMIIASDGFSNLDKGLNYGYEMVVINGETAV